MCVACSGAAGTARPAAPPAPAPRPHIIDLMPDFWSFWDRAGAATGAERVARFKEIALGPHLDYYTKVPHLPSDERLEKYLDTLAPAIPALRRIDAEFHDQLPRGYASFIAAYPDMDRDLPIYVGPSLFTSSGQSRDLDGRIIVMYGLDVVAVVLADVTNHLPDIHHEMFHAYHWQRNSVVAAAGRESFEETRTTPMYYDLWSEGLAVLAARRLNPGAPLALLLSSPVLPEKGPPVAARVAEELRERLDSTDLDEIGQYFFFSTKRTDFPPRIAYYVGLQVAEEVGRRMSMDAMLRLQGADLRREVESALRAIEGRGAQPSAAAPSKKSTTPDSSEYSAPTTTRPASAINRSRSGEP